MEKDEELEKARCAAFEEMAARYDEAVKSLSGLSPELLSALDLAAVTGDVPDTRELARLFKTCDPLLERLAKDGVDFVDTLPFVTIRKRYAWSLPTCEAVEACRLAAGDLPLVEAGSGTGYWAAVLESSGIPVFACDDFSSHGDWSKRWRDPDVPTIGEAMAACPGSAVLAVFPTGGSSMEVVSRMGVGATLVHVGDPFCTGCRDYWDILERDFALVRSLPAWDGRKCPAGFVAVRRRVTDRPQTAAETVAGRIVAIMHSNPSWPSWLGAAPQGKGARP